MTRFHATDMSSESELPPEAIEAKYGTFRRNVLTAYKARHSLRALDAAVSWVEDKVSDQHAVPLDRPVFVLGNFRSGTTFLEQVLARHPSFGHFTLATSAFPRSPRFADAMRRTIPGFLNVMVPPHQPNMVIDGSSPFEAESLWRFCRNNPWTHGGSNVLDADFSDLPFEKLLHRTMSKQLRQQGRSRFLYKNPPNTVRIGFLARVFPDARFVYIVRHPVRMLRSQLDMEQLYSGLFPHSDRRDYGEAFSNLFLPRARVFLRTGRHHAIAAAYARNPAVGVAMSLTDVHAEAERMIERHNLSDRVLTIRYEDLTTHFESEMTKVFAFAGLTDTWASSIVREQAHAVDDKLLSRRSPLPRFDEEVMAALQPLLDRFAYPAN